MNSFPCPPTIGDSLIVGNEQCDDGNQDSNDGCSSTGMIETNGHCDNSVLPSRCNVCGNGK